MCFDFMHCSLCNCTDQRARFCGHKLKVNYKMASAVSKPFSGASDAEHLFIRAKKEIIRLKPGQADALVMLLHAASSEQEVNKLYCELVDTIKLYFSSVTAIRS